MCCECGQKGSNGFNDVNRMIGQLDWYLLPFNMWKMFFMIVTTAKKSVVFRGYGSFTYSRDSFKEVKSKEKWKFRLDFGSRDQFLYQLRVNDSIILGS